MPSSLTRREIIFALTAGALAAPLALPAADSGNPLFFTPDEFAALDTLTEILIPTDAHSPGAHAAEVAPFIDRKVAEAFLPEDKKSWKEGLTAVNSLSKKMNGKPFNGASKENQVEVVRSMAAPFEEGKETAAQKFFGNLKTTTTFAYYSSKVGIHQEMHYKGNVLLEKFVGYLPDDELPSMSSLQALA